MRDVSNPQPICAFPLEDGGVCKHQVKKTGIRCWQHARGFKQIWASIVSNRTLLFFLAVGGVLLSLSGYTLRGTHLNKKSPLKVTLSEPETTQQKIGTFKFSSPKEGWLPQWGQTAGDLVYGVTPGLDLGPARGQYRFMLAVRIEDPTIERNQDTSIVKSAAYEIKNEATTLAVRVDQEFMRRLHGASMVSVSLVMMPTAVEPTQIHKLADVGPRGGAILATNMFLFQTVTVVTSNPNLSPNTTGNQPK